MFPQNFNIQHNIWHIFYIFFAFVTISRQQIDNSLLYFLLVILLLVETNFFLIFAASGNCSVQSTVDELIVLQYGTQSFYTDLQYDELWASETLSRPDFTTSALSESSQTSFPSEVDRKKGTASPPSIATCSKWADVERIR
jgi:hypothetical protein